MMRGGGTTAMAGPIRTGGQVVLLLALAVGADSQAAEGPAVAKVVVVPLPPRPTTHAS